MKFQNQVLSLHSDALAADTLMVQKLSGQERMSGLFRFELDLICSDPELDLEAVLYAPAKLGIKVQVKIAGGQVGTSTREIAGVFEEFEQLEEGQGWTKYRAVLVPKLWNTTRSYRSRIFQEMTIEDIVQAVLEKDGLDPQLDFEFQLQRHNDEDPESRPIYPKREYVVQYEESDWAFLARWLEHEGIYFYFTNEEGEEKVVFADTESAYATSAFGDAYPYRPEAKGEGTDSDKFTEEEIRSFRCKQTRLPTQVTVNDYNWRVPSARLHFSEDVREDGTGLQAQYNDHFKDEAQGKAIAKIRKEELECRSRVFHGAGSCRAFRPGTTFSLEEHFRDDFNRSYLLVTVEHEAEQMISLESSTITGVKYENTFTAIADDQPWRPERLTDWPSIKGVMNAKVDAEGDGKYAELDEHGRYKLKMPFDEHSDDAPDGKASRWVRMAQPYAGNNAGMHFPLLKGTEVLLTHVDGDPDRPVISGAVPNPETESPATDKSQTRNAIKTASGNTMQIDDDENAQGFLWRDADCSFVSDVRRHKGKGGTNAGFGLTPAGGDGGAVGPHLPRPQSGSGMPTADNNKSGGWNDALKQSWEDFLKGQARKDVRAGRYRDGGNPLGLSTWSEVGVIAGFTGDGVGLPGQPRDKLDTDGLRSLLYVLGKASKGAPDGRNYSGINRGNVDDILNNLHSFTGEAYGSRLRTWLGDDLFIKVGDKYTYADVSTDVSIGTGGYSLHEEHGDTNDNSFHWGNSISMSKTWGNSQSTSFNEGARNSTSFRFGLDCSESFTFDAGISFSLHAGCRTDNSINLLAFNSNSLFMGVKGGLDLYLAAKTQIEIGASFTWDIKLCAAMAYTMKCVPSETELNAKHTTKLSLKETIAELEQTQASLARTKATVANNQNDILKAANQINDTQNALSTNRQALNQGVRALAAQQQVLSADDVALIQSSRNAMNTMTNGLTSM